MSNDISIPRPVLDTFPVLTNATFIRRLASPVPLVPDTTFDIFTTGSQEFLCLVTSDYPDPEHQSLELKGISGEHEFEFLNLLKPGGENGETIEILEHDDMDGDFLIYLPYKTYRLGYYVANIQAQPQGVKHTPPMKDGSNQNWDSYYSENRDFSLMTSQALTKILRHVDADLEKTCLDLGCGTGQLTRELFHRGYDCVGVDLVESAVHIAQSLTTQTPHLTYLQGNLETFKPADLPRQQFSLVTCKLVFAFIKDKERFLKLVYELLSPGGTFVVITPVFGSEISKKKPGICVDRDETEKQLQEEFRSVTIEPLDTFECFIAHKIL